MIRPTSSFSATGDRGSGWYDLFSRGARDWLRHNEKIQDAVRKRLPDLLAGSDLITGDGKQKVQVPVRMLEHYRFRLGDPSEGEGVGQGDVQPGDVLQNGRPKPGKGRGGSGEGEGGPEFLVELEVNDIVDWLWEELELPNLEPKTGPSDDTVYSREGWDKTGPRARLDRRRTLKQAVRRRLIQPDGPAFSNEDLRFRQLVQRPRPLMQAVVLLGLDASSSMVERDRKLAKAFFFWALQGLRRQYTRLETVFVAHTTRAWEFSEEEFFRVTAHGGTVASTAFTLVDQIVQERYNPDAYNVYFLYASDGENYSEDREAAVDALVRIGRYARFTGFVQTGRSPVGFRQSETAQVFAGLDEAGAPWASYTLQGDDDVWAAIRSFFHAQMQPDMT